MATTRATRWLLLIAALFALAPMLVVFFDQLFGHVPRGPFAGDYALLELCVRKAARGEQLLGPYSRFGWTHPGPLYFYAIVPFHWLARGASSALHVAASTIQLASVVALLFVGTRVVRTPIARAVSLLALVLATRAFLVEPYATGFASPWNPTVTVFPFALLVVLAAHCAGRKKRGLSLLVLLHAFVCQTHVGNVPIATAIVLASVIMRLRSGGVRWTAPTLTALVAWSPVMIEGDNLRALVKFFLHPTHAQPFLHTVGYADQRIVATHLPSLSIRNGLNLLIAIEIALLLGAWVTRRREAARFAIIVALMVVLDFVGASRIQDELFPHLTPSYVLTLPVALAAIAACWERPRPFRRRTIVGTALALLSTAPFVMPDVRRARAISRDSPDPFGLDAVEAASIVSRAIDGGRSVKLDGRGEEAWAALAGTMLALEKMGRTFTVADRWMSVTHHLVRAQPSDLEVFVDVGTFHDVAPVAKLRVVSLGARQVEARLARPRVASSAHAKGDTALLVDGVDARGSSFDAPSSVQLAPNGYVAFDLTAKDPIGLRIHADSNDEYEILASADLVQFTSVGLVPPGIGFGMQPRDFYFGERPPAFVRIAPARGDGAYALSEVAVLTGTSTVDAITFGEPAARERLLGGWSFDERNEDGAFVWAQGTEARCVIHTGPTPRALRLAFELEPMAVPGREQLMTVLVGDSTVARVAINAEQRSYDVALPAALVTPSRTELTFRFSYAIAPSTVDRSSSDERPLAVAFHSLRVAHADVQWWE